jgi:hypothetical protein
MAEQDLLQLVVPMPIELERLAYAFTTDDHLR